MANEPKFTNCLTGAGHNYDHIETTPSYPDEGYVAGGQAPAKRTYIPYCRKCGETKEL